MRLATLPLALALTLASASVAQAYHASCAGGQVPNGQRCVVHNNIAIGSPGSGGWLVCSSNNPSQGEVQYDWMTIFAGQSRYVCTHYHDCNEVQSVHPGVYDAYCQ